MTTTLDTYVLVNTRRGDIQELFVGTDVDELKARAERSEGAPLTWRSMFGSYGAHSPVDDETTYEIMKASRVA